VFRPTGFADLAGRRVGIWGYGVEGQASERRLTSIAELVVVDDEPGRGPHVLRTHEGGLDALKTCDVVLKSPGIARRRDEVAELEAHGVVVTSALNLWLKEVDRARVIAITGTKGKSTTTGLVTFFLSSLGETAHALGNIGRPPYDPDLDLSLGWLVLEVSSFQSVDLEVAPAVVVVTSLGADHLDWHGSLTQYHADKLSVTRASGEHLTLVADSPALRDASALLGGEVRFVAGGDEALAHQLGLVGRHNEENVAVALATTAAVTGRRLGDVRDAVRAHAKDFTPLPGRLTVVATETTTRGDVRYVDDALATSPLPTRAALDVFSGEAVALIAGGFDRGVDYRPLAEALATSPALTALIVTGPAGERLASAFEALRPATALLRVTTMHDAVRSARAALPDKGVVLLSPAAPSFDAYQNWEERSQDFRRVVAELLGRPGETR